MTAGRDADREAFVTAMMGLHGALEQRFFRHQQALLDRDLDRAAEWLRAYREALFRHIADEEEQILPRYADLGGDATDAPVRLFLGEHRNLRAFVEEFVERVAALQAAPRDGGEADARDRRLLELFDRQATFKNLQLHHDLRERNMLYPFLAARLSAPARAAIVAGLRFRG